MLMKIEFVTFRVGLQLLNEKGREEVITIYSGLCISDKVVHHYWSSPSLHVETAFKIGHWFMTKIMVDRHHFNSIMMLNYSISIGLSAWSGNLSWFSVEFSYFLAHIMAITGGALHLYHEAFCRSFWCFLSVIAQLTLLFI